MNIAHKPDVIYDPEHQKMHRLRDVEAENRQESQRIKIEALRAAAATMKIRIEKGQTGRFGFTTKHVIDAAEQFRAWLSES